MNTQSVEIPKTIAETVFLHLKKLIITGELKPNQKITEKEIIGVFNVSSTPVREAIQRLCSEKYLERNDRKNVIVKPIPYELVKELYEIINVLDSYVLIKCVLIMSDKEIDEIKALTEELSNYSENNDVENFIKINLKIHDRIWQNSENGYLYETMHNLLEKIEIHLVRSDYEPFRKPGALIKSRNEHLQMMKAIEKRDVKKLKELIEDHWGRELYSKEE